MSVGDIGIVRSAHRRKSRYGVVVTLAALVLAMPAVLVEGKVPIPPLPGPIGWPAVGVVAVLAAIGYWVRLSRRRLLVSERALVVPGAGADPIAIDEVSTLRLRPPAGGLDRDKPTYSLWVETLAGRKVEIDPGWEHYRAAADAVVAAVAPHVLKRLRPAYAKGDVVVFGPVAVDRARVAWRGGELPVDDFGGLELHDGEVWIMRRGAHAATTRIPIGDFANLPVAVLLLKEVLGRSVGMRAELMFGPED